MMFTLPKSISDWGNDSFDSTFKQETLALKSGSLPLDQGMTYGSAALHDKLEIMVLSRGETDSHLNVKTGVFFSSVIAGCNCADDPTPIDKQNEYCELEFKINKLNGETLIQCLS